MKGRGDGRFRRDLRFLARLQLAGLRRRNLHAQRQAIQIDDFGNRSSGIHRLPG